MNIMELIAKAMTREQIHAVSLYYASVRPTDVTPQDQALVSRAGRPTGEGASTFKRNPTSVGATPEPQVGQGAGVVSGAQPAAPPAPTVEFPIGLPRRPADPNRLPPYLPFTDGQRGGMTTTGAPPGDRK